MLAVFCGVLPSPPNNCCRASTPHGGTPASRRHNVLFCVIKEHSRRRRLKSRGCECSGTCRRTHRHKAGAPVLSQAVQMRTMCSIQRVHRLLLRCAARLCVLCVVVVGYAVRGQGQEQVAVQHDALWRRVEQRGSVLLPSQRLHSKPVDAIAAVAELPAEPGPRHGRYLIPRYTDAARGGLTSQWAQAVRRHILLIAAEWWRIGDISHQSNSLLNPNALCPTHSAIAQGSPSASLRSLCILERCLLGTAVVPKHDCGASKVTGLFRASEAATLLAFGNVLSSGWTRPACC